jgi:hypothetical protein
MLLLLLLLRDDCIQPPGAILEVQRAIETVYPEYNDLTVKAENGFGPTLTLGQFEKEQADATLAKLQADWQPVEFPVSEVREGEARARARARRRDDEGDERRWNAHRCTC